jgi:hypothetical protein
LKDYSYGTRSGFAQDCVVGLTAYPHPPLSANFVLSFTMKLTVMQRARHCRRGKRLHLLRVQCIFAILAPSGNGLPLPGTPAA